MRLVILGKPRTKKTSNRVLRFGKFNKIVPSAQYLAWRDEALRQLRSQGGAVDLAQPVNVRAIVYRDAARGDLIGYLQGIADALEEAGVVADDKWIEGWDGSRLDKDAARPRIEVTIQRATRSEETPMTQDGTPIADADEVVLTIVRRAADPRVLAVQGPGEPKHVLEVLENAAVQMRARLGATAPPQRGTPPR